MVQQHSEAEIRPFQIEVPQADLDDLNERLARTRWPDELPCAGWDYGVPLGYLKKLAEHWRTSYNWRKYESWLNGFPQFTTIIDGTNIHFFHVRSHEPTALPLLLIHGWPGSIMEFTQLIEPLTNPRAYGGDPKDAFHLVIPSIPGFGFSGPTRDSGWDINRISRAFSVLMGRLGYESYGAHGGDAGAMISRKLARINSTNLIGVHLTYEPSSVPSNDQDPSELTNLSESEQERVRISAQRKSEFSRKELGYAMIQSTKPQTLSYGLTDSPVGQLAWIVEKFRAFTDSVEFPEEAVDRDQMLTNVMLYWLTGTANSSARLYYEMANAGSEWGKPEEPSAVPTGIAVFPFDTSLPVRYLAERTNNIIHWTEFERGGHFPGMEEPDLLIRDLQDFFRKLR
ncbi:MAG TPA: epoxide hydrolase [Bacillales bacterium]|nr:epoxide hydrolase [Bacillales bacterium]